MVVSASLFGGPPMNRTLTVMLDLDNVDLMRVAEFLGLKQPYADVAVLNRFAAGELEQSFRALREYVRRSS